LDNPFALAPNALDQEFGLLGLAQGPSFCRGPHQIAIRKLLLLALGSAGRR